VCEKSRDEGVPDFFRGERRKVVEGVLTVTTSARTTTKLACFGLPRKGWVDVGIRQMKWTARGGVPFLWLAFQVEIDEVR